MKWKEKDDLSWCCISRRHSNDESEYTTKQPTKVVLMLRSAEDVSLPVEKVKKKRKKKEKKKKKSTKNIFASFPSFSSSSTCFPYLRFLIMTTHHRVSLRLPRSSSIRKV
jgi:hypothetical protein